MRVREEVGTGVGFDFSGLNIARHVERRNTHLSIRDVAKLCGVRLFTIQHSINTGVLPEPTHKLHGFAGWYFTVAEAREVVERFRSLREARGELPGPKRPKPSLVGIPR